MRVLAAAALALAAGTLWGSAAVRAEPEAVKRKTPPPSEKKLKKTKPSPDDVPSVLKVSFNAALGDDISIVWDGKARVVKLTVESPEDARDQKKTIAPTPTQWAAFWKAMDEARLWEWAPRYADEDVIDGGVWALEIARSNGGKTAKSSGRNAYPSDADPKKPTTAGGNAKLFSKYVEGLELLVGKLH